MFNLLGKKIVSLMLFVLLVTQSASAVEDNNLTNTQLHSVMGIVTNLILFPPEAKLLFKSGFNNNVTISNPNLHNIVGQDSESGYVWPNDLPGDNTRNSFNYLVDDLENLNTYIETKIIDISNNKKALYIKYKKNDVRTYASSRVHYNLWAKQNALSKSDSLKKLYIKYKIKMHIEDSEELWRNFMEWDTTGEGENYRWALYISKTKYTNGLIWRLNAESIKYNSPEDLDKIILWEHVNNEIPVPLDEWFELEVFWNLSNNGDGKILVAVNGETLFERIGANKYNTKNFAFWNPFKVYGAKGFSVITDVEIWDDIP